MAPHGRHCNARRERGWKRREERALAQGWSNWSGSVKATPRLVASPKTEAALAAQIGRGRKLRVVGAAHDPWGKFANAHLAALFDVPEARDGQ